jgi:hypothetical protein
VRQVEEAGRRAWNTSRAIVRRMTRGSKVMVWQKDHQLGDPLQQQ